MVSLNSKLMNLLAELPFIQNLEQNTSGFINSIK
jgi:hypothetical protein